MTLAIDRGERDCLHALMAYRFFIGDDLRLKRAQEEGVGRVRLALEFCEDMQLMAHLAWLPQELMEALAMPEASAAGFELNLPTDALRGTLRRARADAQHGFADGCIQTPNETDDERFERFQVAARTCDVLLARLDSQKEASA
jgi:hypothetical protein